MLIVKGNRNIEIFYSLLSNRRVVCTSGIFCTSADSIRQVMVIFFGWGGNDVL